MRVLVIHDDSGKIIGAVTGPADAPPMHVIPRAGESITEVDLAAADLDPAELKDAEQLLATLREHRVDVTHKPALVRR